MDVDSERLTASPIHVTIESPLMPESDDQLDLLMRALSDRTRRNLLTTIGREPGLTTAELARRTRAMSRWGVMKHLAVLAAAGLIQSMPEGRRTRHFIERHALEPLREWLARELG
jgi:DNA-binding transcriptional ArsR family regulator